MPRQKRIPISDFYCQECNCHIQLPRKPGQKRGLAHVKDIYCIKCKKVTKHIEVREKDFALNYVLDASGNSYTPPSEKIYWG